MCYVKRGLVAGYIDFHYSNHAGKIASMVMAEKEKILMIMTLRAKYLSPANEKISYWQYFSYCKHAILTIKFTS